MTPVAVHRPVRPLGRLHIAGVDVVIAPDGVPHLIEINDRPLLLARSAIRVDGVAPTRGAVDALAVDLLAAAPRGEVGVVLSEAFALPGGAEVVVDQVSSWRPVGADAFVDDVRIRGVVEDLDAVTAAVVCAGGRLRVVEAAAAARLWTAEPDPTGLPVWNRSQIDIRWPGPVVNHRAATALCIDKLTTRRLCGGIGGDVPAVEAVAHSAAPFDGAGPLVLKPRNGSGSRSVHRGHWGELRGIVDAGAGREDYVVEPWIEPATLADGDRDYRFDLRVFVVGGTTVGMLARRAAAAMSPLVAGSPLSWLTTTGRVLAVREAPAGVATTDGDVAMLPGPWLAVAAGLAERATAAVEDAAQLRTVPPPPSFAQLHAISGPVRPVVLDVRAAA
ncbi:hypothetical protein [Micromonospora sp. LOL_024]|uniref:hypothetical protein n=1 Tax=Micromonospora sp. LOL_024 TaxID=3345412 RepID=UPI003A8A2152